MIHWIVLLLTLSSPTLLCGLTFAHKPSDSYLHLSVNDAGFRGQWDIALRDLDYAIGLDGNDDGKITWAEVRLQHEAIAAYALTRFTIRRGDTGCWSHPTEHLVNHHSDGAYAVIRFSIQCPTSAKTLSLNYQLFFDLDPLHRGLLHVNHKGHTQTAVFSPEHQSAHLDLTASSPWREFLQYVREGIWHIWVGYDHILFLICLLLPAVLRWGGRWWQPVKYFRPAVWEVFKIVTAFTLAHSVTLSLAMFGIVKLPSRWVESAIAASVLLAALHNFFPVFRSRLWPVTFVFGLIHGLGFASVLLDFGVPKTAVILALGGFNLGVEVGQIAIVGTIFPLAFLIRHTWSYQQLVVGMGSVVAAFVASIWLVERSLDLNIGMGGW